MKAPPELATDRLTLVRPKTEDASEVFERYASDPEVTRFLGWPRHTSVSDTQAFLIFSASEWERWPAGPYLIRRRSDGWLLGGTGLGFESPMQAVTGYVLAKDAWGKATRRSPSPLWWMSLDKRECGVFTLCAIRSIGRHGVSSRNADSSERATNHSQRNSKSGAGGVAGSAPISVGAQSARWGVVAFR